MKSAELIALVEATAPPATALGRVAVAVRISAEVSQAADTTVAHFVDAARQHGHSWSEIGGQLGVSKQAALKRFAAVPALTLVQSTGDLELRPRLRSCLEAAHREAHSDGSAEPGSQHLLLGLFAEGYAASVLDTLGITVDRARAEARRLSPAPPSADADDALAAAARFAQDCGRDSVGTEHLLFVLAHDRGSRACRVLERLGVGAALRRTLRCYEPSPRRRRRRGPDPCRCSFCRRCADQVRLVAGPGVWICRQCVDLSAEILARETPPSG